jgi:hypothetical protein
MEGQRPNNGGPDYNTTVTMEFKSTDDGRTLVEIAEEGWRETPNGLCSLEEGRLTDALMNGRRVLAISTAFINDWYVGEFR